MKQVIKGEIYYADLGIGKGSEQNGVRPVIIIQNDHENKFSSTTIIAPITGQFKKFDKTHIILDCLKKKSNVLLEQMRVVDKIRLKDYICKVDDKTMIEINRKILITLGI
jgi:mRNA interferase MazF